jgi:hypothetical protein
MKLGNEENFLHILNNFVRLLYQIGFSTDDVTSWESKISWTANDSEIISIQSIPSNHGILLEINQQKLMVFPSIIVWNDHIDSYVFEEPWVELLIRIKSEDQTGFDLDSECETLFFKIMSVISEAFQETGVYVTNEMQDGEAFLGFVNMEEEKYWEFDYAIIPYQYHELYKETAIGFNRYTLPNGIGYARRAV